jgi:hypothetical protein
MEIEFNTSRIGQPDLAQAVGKPTASKPVSDAASFPSATSLEAALNNVPATRPEKVQLAKALVANVQFPPNDVLDRIAVLLALSHIR